MLIFRQLHLPVEQLEGHVLVFSIYFVYVFLEQKFLLEVLCQLNLKLCQILLILLLSGLLLLKKRIRASLRGCCQLRSEPCYFLSELVNYFRVVLDVKIDT